MQFEGYSHQRHWNIRESFLCQLHSHRASATTSTYTSTSTSRYECTRLFDGCCLLQTIKAAFPPLLGPPLTPVYGCVCVCVRHGRPVLLLLLLLLLLGCSAFQAAKAHKREESSSLFVSSRLVSVSLSWILGFALCFVQTNYPDCVCRLSSLWSWHSCRSSSTPCCCCFYSCCRHHTHIITGKTHARQPDRCACVCVCVRASCIKLFT